MPYLSSRRIIASQPGRQYGGEKENGEKNENGQVPIAKKPATQMLQALLLSMLYDIGCVLARNITGCVGRMNSRFPCVLKHKYKAQSAALLNILIVSGY